MTNKKIDRKLIALGQSHERAYMKKIAKQWLDRLELDNKQCKEYNSTGNVTLYVDSKDPWETKDYRTKSLIRCLKALLKYLERDKR